MDSLCPFGVPMKKSKVLFDDDDGSGDDDDSSASGDEDEREAAMQNALADDKLDTGIARMIGGRQAVEEMQQAQKAAEQADQSSSDEAEKEPSQPEKEAEKRMVDAKAEISARSIIRRVDA